jgi:hypothetical protein
MASQNQPNQPQQPNHSQDANRTNNRGINLSQQDRSRGGQHSAQLQQRDAQGQFAGKKSGTSDRPGTSADWRDERSPSTHSGAAAAEGASGPKLPNQDDEDTDREDQTLPDTDEDTDSDDPDVDETEDQESVNTARSNARPRHH